MLDPGLFERPEARRTFVRQMFDGIAGTYDLLNHALSLGVDIHWRKKAVDFLNPRSDWRILDLATGTGDLGFEAASRMPGLKVVGVDLATRMLQRGMDKRARRKEQMGFVCGDVEQLPFPDATFDGITIGFGIRNVVDLDSGVKEMYRVLKPGGRAAVLEFSRPRHFPIRGLYHFYFRHVLPRIGRLVSRNPNAYHYLYASVMRFPEGAAFCSRLAKPGFEMVAEHRLSLGIASLYLASKPGP